MHEVLGVQTIRNSLMSCTMTATTATLAFMGGVTLLHGDGLAQVERQVAVASTQLGRWVGDAASEPLAPRTALTLPAWTEGALPQHLSQHPQIAAAVRRSHTRSPMTAFLLLFLNSFWNLGINPMLR